MSQTKIKLQQIVEFETPGEGNNTAGAPTVQVLASVAVTTTTADKYPLFTVPAGKQLVVTEVYIRLLSGVDFADYGTQAFLGYQPDCSDQSGFCELTAINAPGAILRAEGRAAGKAFRGIGQPGDVFGFKTTNVGPAANLEIDVLGYLLDA